MMRRTKTMLLPSRHQGVLREMLLPSLSSSKLRPPFFNFFEKRPARNAKRRTEDRRHVTPFFLSSTLSTSPFCAQRKSVVIHDTCGWNSVTIFTRRCINRTYLLRPQQQTRSFCGGAAVAGGDRDQQANNDGDEDSIHSSARRRSENRLENQNLFSDEGEDAAVNVSRCCQHKSQHGCCSHRNPSPPTPPPPLLLLPFLVRFASSADIENFRVDELRAVCTVLGIPHWRIEGGVGLGDGGSLGHGMGHFDDGQGNNRDHQWFGDAADDDGIHRADIYGELNDALRLVRTTDDNTAAPQCTTLSSPPTPPLPPPPAFVVLHLPTVADAIAVAHRSVLVRSISLLVARSPTVDGLVECVRNRVAWEEEIRGRGRRLFWGMEEKDAGRGRMEEEMKCSDQDYLRDNDVNDDDDDFTFTNPTEKGTKTMLLRSVLLNSAQISQHDRNRKEVARSVSTRKIRIRRAQIGDDHEADDVMGGTNDAVKRDKCDTASASVSPFSSSSSSSSSFPPFFLTPLVEDERLRFKYTVEGVGSSLPREEQFAIMDRFLRTGKEGNEERGKKEGDGAESEKSPSETAVATTNVIPPPVMRHRGSVDIKAPDIVFNISLLYENSVVNTTSSGSGTASSLIRDKQQMQKLDDSFPSPPPPSSPPPLLLGAALSIPVAFGARAFLLEWYSLSRRPYIGTTSMPPEYAFLMSNLALIGRRRGRVQTEEEENFSQSPPTAKAVARTVGCYDPFCGTCSILVSCTHHLLLSNAASTGNGANTKRSSSSSSSPSNDTTAMMGCDLSSSASSSVSSALSSSSVASPPTLFALGTDIDVAAMRGGGVKFQHAPQILQQQQEAMRHWRHLIVKDDANTPNKDTKASPHPQHSLAFHDSRAPFLPASPPPTKTAQKASAGHPLSSPPSVDTNFKVYGLPAPERAQFDFSKWEEGFFFAPPACFFNSSACSSMDAIVTDPPYGIRERKHHHHHHDTSSSAFNSLSTAAVKGENVEASEEDFDNLNGVDDSSNMSSQSDCAVRCPLTVELVQFAACHLSVGGRLCFWYATTRRKPPLSSSSSSHSPAIADSDSKREETNSSEPRRQTPSRHHFIYEDELPRHPLMKLVLARPQTLNNSLVRVLVVMERCADPFYFPMPKPKPKSTAHAIRDGYVCKSLLTPYADAFGFSEEAIVEKSKGSEEKVRKGVSDSSKSPPVKSHGGQTSPQLFSAESNRSLARQRSHTTLVNRERKLALRRRLNDPSHPQ